MWVVVEANNFDNNIGVSVLFEKKECAEKALSQRYYDAVENAVVESSKKSPEEYFALLGNGDYLYGQVKEVKR